MSFLRRLTWCVVALGFVTVRGNGEAKELDQRTRCIALVKEVLTNAIARDAAVFSKILDGHGDKRFKLIAWSELDESLERAGGREKFFEKNFPGIRGILAHFDRIKFSEIRSEGAVGIMGQKNGQATEGSGELFVMETELPKETGVDLEKQGSEGYKVYSRVRFVQYEGRLYWVPFGW